MPSAGGLWARLGCGRLCGRLHRRRRRVGPEDVNGKPSRSRESRRRINHAPPPQYSALGERARTLAPAALQCALFCGGARCRYEQPLQPAPTAIQGLYSDCDLTAIKATPTQRLPRHSSTRNVANCRITDDILAMARPSTASIAARNILQQFHSWGIRTVVNLQTPGEHASCGPPLTASGFTYDPAVFMDNDIFYYNFAWADYGEASLSGLLDMAKVLSFALQEGRVAIHCHAGLGRTGVLIACYLVYSLRVRANDAIRLVRRRRARSVQTSGQILCVQQFEHYYLPQTVVFSCRDPLQLTADRKTAQFTLRQHLHRQRATLHGLDERAFRELPKIVYLLCERLLQLCGCRRGAGPDMRVRARPFYRQFVGYRRRPQPPDPAETEVVEEEDERSLPTLRWRDSTEEEIDRHLETVSRITGASAGGHVAAVHVYDAFVLDHNSLPEERKRFMRELRTDLNQRSEAMDKIEEEDDPTVLAWLLLEWLEGLKQPVLGREDLAAVVARGHVLDSALAALPLEDVILLEYLLRFVIRLRPLSAAKKVDIIRRLLASLCHQTVSVNGTRLPTHKEYPRLRDGTNGRLTNFVLSMIVEIQRDMARPGRDDGDVVVPRRPRVRCWK